MGYDSVGGCGKAITLEVVAQYDEFSAKIKQQWTSSGEESTARQQLNNREKMH
jgi:hypothetical protein